MTSILYIFRHSPWQGRQPTDGLDMLMASCALELPVNALFVHDGVWILQPSQYQELGLQSTSDQPLESVALSDLAATTKPFKALFDFGCEAVHVCERSMRARGLVSEDLVLDVEMSSRTDIADLIKRHDRVLVF